MNTEEMLKAISQEHKEETKAFVLRFGVTPEKVEPSFDRIRDLANRFYYLTVNTGSAVSGDF